MTLSCEVIKDLLPLYYDKVCSKESCSLIEEHLAQCPQCVNELQKLEINLGKPSVSEDEVNAIKRISEAWKKDKRVSFAKGSMLISALAAIICFISYHIIGAKVLPDGTLVEPFPLVPIGNLFVLVFIISLICSLIFSRKPDKRVSFSRVSTLVSALAAIICFVSYHIIGAKVLPDGTLVEPFALIGYLFVLIFIISLICSLIVSRKQN